MTVRAFSYSSFLRSPAQALPSLDHTDVMLERRDEENLVLMREERFEATLSGMRLAARSLAILTERHRTYRRPVNVCRMENQDLRYLATMLLEVRVMAAASKAARQSSLEVDPETDRLISQGAHFLGLAEKEFVAEAVRGYLEQRREDRRAGMVEALQGLDGSLQSDVMPLTGLTAAEIDAVGGIDE